MVRCLPVANGTGEKGTSAVIFKDIFAPIEGVLCSLSAYVAQRSKGRAPSGLLGSPSSAGALQVRRLRGATIGRERYCVYLKGLVGEG
eukprot:2452991-Alexandrium_andersonii.AAC.1